MPNTTDTTNTTDNTTDTTDTTINEAPNHVHGDGVSEPSPGTCCEGCLAAGVITVWTAEQHEWLSTADCAELLDADTNELIRALSAHDSELVVASATADGGVILVDADGELVAEGSWDASQPGVRRAYVG